MPAHPRWVQVSFRNQEGAFLAGAVAAARSRSGNIGYVGAHPGLVDDFRAGYEAGAAHVDPSVQVLSAYTPTYLHPLENFLPRSAERSGAVAQELLDAGADVLFAAHGEGGVGVLRTVAADGTGWAIGVDSDQYLGLLDTEPAAAERVLASMVKRFDRAVSLAVEQALAELGGELAMTLENGGFAIVDTAGRLTEDEAAIVEASKTGIVAGRIEVPEWTSTAPTVVPAGAVEMSVVLDDAGSRLDQPADLVVGTTLVVSGRNDAGFPLGLAVGRPAPGVTADDLASAPSVRTPFERDLWEIRTAHNWTAVLPGGEGAISVVLDQPGTWAVGYTLLGDPFQPLGTWTTFEVTAGG